MLVIVGIDALECVGPRSNAQTITKPIECFKQLRVLTKSSLIYKGFRSHFCSSHLPKSHDGSSPDFFPTNSPQRFVSVEPQTYIRLVVSLLQNVSAWSRSPSLNPSQFYLFFTKAPPDLDLDEGFSTHPSHPVPCANPKRNENDEDVLIQDKVQTTSHGRIDEVIDGYKPSHLINARIWRRQNQTTMLAALRYAARRIVEGHTLQRARAAVEEV